MRRIFFITLIFLSISSIAQENVDKKPDWFNNPPVSTKKFYGVGEGTSSRIDIAEQKAIIAANLQIAEQVNPPKVQDIKTTTKKVNGKDNEKIIYRETVKSQLKGVTVVKKVSFQKDSTFIVYVLVEMKKKQ